MIIQTVFRPEENADYIEEWLDYHTNIGISHFYMYENSNGIETRLLQYGKYYENENNIKLDYIEYEDQKKVNKHGVAYNFSYDKDKLENILKKFSVTKVKWQRKNKYGTITYNQREAMLNFAKNIKKGLCAFIDIDEYLIKNEDFFPCRLQQHKYKSRFMFMSIFDIHDRVKLKYTKNWNPKAIIDMSNFPKHFQDCHFRNIDLPETSNYINHYNHNEISHTAYDHGQTPEFSKIPYNEVFEFVDNPFKTNK
jgi:hypothetical protein